MNQRVSIGRGAATILLALATLAATAGPVHAKTLKVVATTRTFASLVMEVGGEEVSVTTVSPPCDDVHFIEPRPSSIARLAQADAFVHAGLDLELWRGPLVEASRNRDVFRGGAGEIDLSESVPLLEVPTTTLTRAEGDIHVYGNPHYWMDPDNIEVVTANIARRLSALAPENAARFEENRAAFLERLAAASEAWSAKLAPHRGGEFVSYHRDWPYFARHFGLSNEIHLEPKPNIPPSARHLQQVIGEMNARGLTVVVREPFHPAKAVRTVASATGSTGVVLSQQTGCLPHTDDYISLMDANVHALAAGFAGEAAP